MIRLAIGAFIGLAIGVVLAAAVGIHAQTEPDDDVQAVADEAGVDGIALQGAVNSTGLAPADYLVAVGELPGRSFPPVSGVNVGGPGVSPAPGLSARVRLTYYVEGGRTYSGGKTYAGSTACSWNFALGTRFMLPNGETFVCNDRGLLGGAPGWLDLWRRPDLVKRYGPYATVTVVP